MERCVGGAAETDADAACGRDDDATMTESEAAAPIGLTSCRDVETADEEESTCTFGKTTDARFVVVPLGLPPWATFARAEDGDARLRGAGSVLCARRGRPRRARGSNPRSRGGAPRERARGVASVGFESERAPREMPPLGAVLLPRRAAAAPSSATTPRASSSRRATPRRARGGVAARPRHRLPADLRPRGATRFVVRRASSSSSSFDDRPRAPRYYDEADTWSDELEWGEWPTRGGSDAEDATSSRDRDRGDGDGADDDGWWRESSSRSSFADDPFAPPTPPSSLFSGDALPAAVGAVVSFVLTIIASVSDATARVLARTTPRGVPMATLRTLSYLLWGFLFFALFQRVVGVVVLVGGLALLAVAVARGEGMGMGPTGAGVGDWDPRDGGDRGTGDAWGSRARNFDAFRDADARRRRRRRREDLFGAAAAAGGEMREFWNASPFESKTPFEFEPDDSGRGGARYGDDDGAGGARRARGDPYGEYPPAYRFAKVKNKRPIAPPRPGPSGL